jgi:hypothetical protein
MTSFLSGMSTPATVITTTTETVCVPIPPTSLILGALSGPNIILRGCVWITAGTGVTGLSVRLRAGYNTIVGPLIGNSVINAAAVASVLQAQPFFWIDTTGLSNLTGLGYSINIVQTAATGNGAVTAVAYEVDYSIP